MIGMCFGNKVTFMDSRIASVSVIISVTAGSGGSGHVVTITEGGLSLTNTPLKVCTYE